MSLRAQQSNPPNYQEIATSDFVLLAMTMSGNLPDLCNLIVRFTYSNMVNLSMDISENMNIDILGSPSRGLCFEIPDLIILHYNNTRGSVHNKEYCL